MGRRGYLWLILYLACFLEIWLVANHRWVDNKKQADACLLDGVDLTFCHQCLLMKGRAV